MVGGGLMTCDIGVHFIFESWDFSVGTSCDLCTVILHRDVCHILDRISTPAGATSNLEVVIHKHLLAFTNFAILTKGLASNQSEPKSGSPIQKSSSSTLTRGHIIFTVSQKQCIKEKNLSSWMWFILLHVFMKEAVSHQETGIQRHLRPILPSWNSEKTSISQ